MTEEYEETTQKYVQLPPPQAVPFTGFHFAKIKSREPVAQRLKEFMKRTKETDFFTTGLIIAEWGEGKTDAYERYIKTEAEKKGYYAYLVSTSSIVNKLSKADVLFPYGAPESVTLMGCTLYALRDELGLRNEDFSKFPDYKEYKDPSEYIEEVLSRHLSTKNEMIYIFIDEFEEILNQPSDIQKKFMSGLKELLNGQLKLIHQGGKFAGRLHLILACTRYAYNRIRGDVDLAQIFGALDQRLSSNRIDLPQVGKAEALQFLIDLLKFCYKHSLPQPLPIKSSGILNGIYIISQRNVRSLVQLLSDLLSSAALDGELLIINYEHFLNTLKGKPISVYGASTQCIDKDFLIKIESTLRNLQHGEDYIKIFRILAGELKPFTIEEIQKRTGVRDVTYRINEINQELKKIGISNAITRLNPLKENEKIEDVIESLKPVENAIPLGTGRKIPVERFTDFTIHYELDSKCAMHPKMFLPADEVELERALDLYQEEAEYLYRIISKRFSSITAKRHYMLSKELTDQLFPSPLVLQLDFILDRSKRMELWRMAMKGFLERDLEFRDGLIEVINLENNFEITGISTDFCLKYTLSSGAQVEIPLAIHSTTGRVTMNDAQNLKEKVKRESRGLVLLFHVGEIEENARGELAVIPNILSIHVRPIRAQQLIALSLARKENVELNANVLRERLLEILYDIDFNQEFTKWLERCRREGLLIEDLKRPSGKSERTLAHAMIYYIQAVEEKLTRENVFNESKKLQAFTLYGGGKKPSFAPLDIETEESLIEYQRELCLNGFLQEEGEEVQIVTTPIERRILDNLKRHKLSIDEIKRRFIIFAQNEKLLEQVYFPILEAKGLIQVTKDGVSLVSKEEREENIQQRMKSYSEKIINKGKEWWTFGHICISKEREDRVIMIKEFDSFLKELFAKLDTPQVRYNEERFLRILRLLNELLTYFEETLDPMITEAWTKGRELVKNVKEKNEEIEIALNSILQFYNSFSEKKYTQTDVEDYVRLKTAFDEVLKTGTSDYKEEEIWDGLDLISSTFEPRQRYEGVPRYFHFNQAKEKASYFNYKVYKIERAEYAFSTRYSEIKDAIDDIIEERRRLQGLGDESRSKLLRYAVDKRYAMSLAFHQALLGYQREPIKPTPLKTLSLKDILNFFEKLYNAQRDFNSKINDSLKILEAMINNEKILLASGEETLNLAVKTVDFFEDGEELSTQASAFLSDVHKYKSMYEKEVVEFHQFMDLKVEIDKLNEKASEAKESLVRIIGSFEQVRRDLKNLFEKGIGILKHKKENILKFIEVLEEGGIDVVMLAKPFEEVIEQAISDINGLKEGKESKYTWKQILNNIEELKKKLFNEVQNILTQDQFNVLLAIVDASARQNWFDLSELKEDLLEQFNLSENKIDKIIEVLVQKKMLKQGVSLPI
jgi:hypothetical protein